MNINLNKKKFGCGCQPSLILVFKIVVNCLRVRSLVVSRVFVLLYVLEILFWVLAVTNSYCIVVLCLGLFLT
jgi:hypothetical protein